MAVEQVKNGCQKDNAFLRHLLVLSGFTYDDIIEFIAKNPTNPGLTKDKDSVNLS